MAYQKLIPNPHGGILAMTGAISTCRKLIDQILTGKVEGGFDLQDEGRIIWFHDCKNATLFEGDHFYDIKIDDFCAWGSGSPVAWGAMGAGASAEEAVRIAARFDAHTGGDILTMRI